MNKLEKHELKGIPPLVFIDTKKEINLLDLTFSVLQKTFEKLKNKLLQKKEKKIKVDSFTKIKLISNLLNRIQNDIDDIIVSLDLDGEWTLTDEDIYRINCNEETNKLFRIFLPYVLTYKFLTDVKNEYQYEN